MTLTNTSDYIKGKTKVRVFRHGQNGPEQIHGGVCVDKTTIAVRVFDPSKKSSDAGPDTSELFAVRSKLIWCEIAGELSDGQELPIPVKFR
jgi:hypothetical protein